MNDGDNVNDDDDRDDIISRKAGEKHFRCEQCNYSRNRAGHLKNHKPTQTGEKFFACKQCNYTCSHSNTLKRHMLSHTGEKHFA